MGPRARQRWIGAADWQAAATLMFDSLVNLSLLAGILLQFGFPATLLSTRILPGSAAAVLFGSLGSAYLAYRLRHATGRDDITAMPFGLDTPSTLGMAMGVLGPAFVAARADARLQGLAPDAAADFAALSAWQLGSAVMVLVGLMKAVCALVGPWFERLLPPAATMGALASIGLLMLGLLPLLEVFTAPLVGLPTLAVVLVGLVAHKRLPGGVPAAGCAVAVGCAIYYGLGSQGIAGCGQFHWPSASLQPTPPHWAPPTLQALRHGFVAMSVAVPFALLTVVGGLSNVAGARAAGDTFAVRSLILTDAAATVLAGCLGGVAQSTPYIGHAAYKKMGARIGYVLIVGVAVGLGGAVGAVHFAIDALPLAAIAPVMVYVGLEICGQAFVATPTRHVPAVLLCFLPTLANLLLMRCEAMLAGVQKSLAVTLAGDAGCAARAAQELSLAFAGSQLQVLRMLGHGFLLVSLLWGAALAWIIDAKPKQAALAMLALSLLTTCGAVHSPRADGGLFWPSERPCQAVFAWSLSYALAAFLLLFVPKDAAKAANSAA